MHFDVVVTDPQPSDLLTVEDGTFSLRHDGAPPAVMRARIDALVAVMLSRPEDHKPMVNEHFLKDGLYVRKMFIEKGTLIAGKIHLKTCVNIVESGDITILTEHGVKRVGAGFCGISAPGIQKVGHAHEDTVFVNVFRTDETDFEKIEAELATAERPSAPTQIEFEMMESP